jgi:hypothetical protein
LHGVKQNTPTLLGKKIHLPEIFLGESKGYFAIQVFCLLSIHNNTSSLTHDCSNNIEPKKGGVWDSFASHPSNYIPFFIRKILGNVFEVFF